MIVPAAALVGCLALDAWRRQASRAAVALIGVVFLALAWAAVRGCSWRAPGPWSRVTRRRSCARCWSSRPSGAAGHGGPPGARAHLGGPRVPGARGRGSTALTLLAIPVAVGVAFRWSHVNGGYYVGLVTPVLCVAAGVGLVIEVIEERFPTIGRSAGVQLLLRGLVPLGLAF